MDELEKSAAQERVAARNLVSSRPPGVGAVQGTAGNVASAALDALTVAASLATKPAEGIFSAIRVIRAARAGGLADQLRAEYEQFAAAGRIKPDYAQTAQAQTLLCDTLSSLEDADFDDEQLEFLRKLFLAAASETVTDRQSVLPREYLDIGRSLATGEIRILSAYYHYLPEWQNTSHVGNLANNIAMGVLVQKTGLQHVALIERHERSLIQKGLVRENGRGYAETDPKHYRLTDFGFAFCEFLACYDQIKRDNTARG